MRRFTVSYPNWVDRYREALEAAPAVADAEQFEAVDERRASGAVASAEAREWTGERPF